MHACTGTMRGNSSSDINSLELTQNSILRININKTIQLIREYKKEECLWNTFLLDYPNRDKRLQAADRVAKILNIPHFEGKHVMIKFKNLRNSYCQELKKIAQSLSTEGSDDSTESYKPKIKWFPLMDSFIRPHLQQVKRIYASRPPQLEEVTADVKLELCDSDEREDWAVPLSSSMGPEISHSYSEQCPSENEDLSNDSRPKKRRLSKPSDYMLNQGILPGDGSGGIANRIEDTYDSFGQYIASLLRSIPPEQALKLQPKIVNMIVNVGVKEVGRVMVKIERLNDQSTDSE